MREGKAGQISVWNILSKSQSNLKTIFTSEVFRSPFAFYSAQFYMPIIYKKPIDLVVPFASEKIVPRKKQVPATQVF